MTKGTHGVSAKRRRILIVVSTVGVLVYMAIALAVDADRLVAALQQLGIVGCVSVFALSGVNYLLRFQRWHGYVQNFGHAIPWSRHLLYYLGGFAFTVSPGKAGEAVRSVYLRDHGVAYSESIAAFFVERLLDLLAVVLLASLLLVDHASYRLLVLAMLVAVTAILVLVSSSHLPDLLKKFAGRQSGRVRAWLAHATNLAVSSASLLRPRLLAVGILMGIVAWGAEGIGFYLVCDALLINISIAAAIGVYSVAVLAGSAAVFLPGGIGGMEIVMTTLLVQTGAPLGTAIVATLLCRLATLWFAVLIGVLAASAIEMSAVMRKNAQVTP